MTAPSLFFQVSITPGHISIMSANVLPRISFSITLVPNRAFCLASLILTQAINDQAFEAGYNTVEEIFDKPNLETVDFIPLKWRPDVKDQEVFRLSDSMLAELFHRTLLVMGVRRSPRYYSLRVGCGARLDGTSTITQAWPQWSAVTNLHG